MNEHMNMTLDFKAIGRRIRNQREALNMSRENLAERIGISNKFCADIEYGVRGMSLATMAKLSCQLKISMDYLVFGWNNQTEVSADENDLLMENILAPLYSCNAKQLKEAGQIVKIFVDAVKGDSNDKE